MEGKPEFHEDMVSEQLDPLHAAATDFDYQEVARCLGEPDTQEQPTEYQRMGLALNRLFAWVLSCDLSNRNTQAMVGRRFLALAWVINPALFDGGPSATALAEKVGINPNSVNVLFLRLTGEVAREFGITNRAQDHAWNRPKAEGERAIPEGSNGNACR